MASRDPESLDAASISEKRPLLRDTVTNSVVKGLDDSSTWAEAYDTVKLAIPIFLSVASFIGMKATDSALLGHVSSDALEAAALSDLWTMCTFVLVNTRILGVLCSSAIGAGNPKLAGIYLQVAYFVLSFAVVFVMLCWCATEQVWRLLGTDANLAIKAGYYARVLALSLPGQLALDQLGQFFSSQRIMHPEVNASSTALALNLVLGLVLVLGIPIPGFSGFGFEACPMVTVSVVYVQFLIIYLVYIRGQRLHANCWDGWSWKEITTARVKAFCELYIPSAMSTSSDFYRVAVIGFIASKLGNVELAVFNLGYRMMLLVLTLVVALSIAAGIKTSQCLGKLDYLAAKRTAWVGIVLSVSVLLVLGTIAHWKIRWIGRIFSDDDEILYLFEQVKLPFSLALVMFNLSIALERIPYSMGRSRDVFWAGFIASWGAQVPAVILFTKYWRHDLVGLFYGMAFGYGMLAFLFGWMVLNSDWKMYAIQARQRSEVE